MAIANGTCVSFCNQRKAHFGIPGYAPGTIGVNRRKEDSMLVKRIAAYTHLSSTVYELARYCSEIAIFSYFLAFNDPVGGVFIGIPGKVWSSEN